ncbi:CLUMA_CG009479, isoform A [Clunio marinus]|uniref:CLUMA_CG009479, isoform A n=1 Tax=Clunio marinus TaxID=568069 RepID=A0A1J1I8J7_9DIPT|nr:CLUMA_CG009479, isoform A [Clunio marinus]
MWMKSVKEKGMKTITHIACQHQSHQQLKQIEKLKLRRHRNIHTFIHTYVHAQCSKTQIFYTACLNST